MSRARAESLAKGPQRTASGLFCRLPGCGTALPGHWNGESPVYCSRRCKKAFEREAWRAELRSDL